MYESKKVVYFFVVLILLGFAFGVVSLADRGDENTYTVEVRSVDADEYNSTIQFEQLNSSAEDEFLRARSTRLYMNTTPELNKYAGEYIMYDGDVYVVLVTIESS